MLRDFQRDFAAAIGRPSAGAMRVYRNTVLRGCTDALKANYPVVERLLGEEMFNAVAAEFAQRSPPDRPILALYGARFPQWIGEQTWVQNIPYVPHVARIERLYLEALFAADREPMTMGALAGEEDWETLKLALHPATRLDWLTTPAVSIFLSERAGREGDLDVEWQAEGVLITRPALEVQAVHLDRAGHRFLSGIRLGESVGTAAIATASLYRQAPIASLFASFVNAGVFAAQ